MSDTTLFEVHRRWLSLKSSIGILSIDGQFECYTLEDQRGPSGASKGCIPAGEYRLGIRLSNRFQRLMPALYDVPGFEGILIHWGNTAVDTIGCLLVGKSKGPDWIGSSRLAFDDLFMKIHDSCLYGPQTIRIYDVETPHPPSTAGLAGITNV